jgi:putative spermidine/putrescine transport system ATP-binding protein
MSGIVLRSVAKEFGETRALEAVSLDIAPGELLALLGPSGCGKTTLLRAVAGLLRPDSGRILIGGRDVTDLPARERPIGMVFQSFALFPNMTVQANVAFPLTVRNTPRADSDLRVRELLELVQLPALADRYPKQISAGQQQRVALARALAAKPDVLLLDEPLSALDALVRTQLRDEMRRIQQAVGTTTIFVTHDQSEAMAIADRVAVMNHGRIEQIAHPLALYDQPDTPFSAAFVGSRNALELPVQAGIVRFGAAFAVARPAAGATTMLAFFRPEDVELVAAGAGQPARVEVKIFLGATTRLHLVAAVDGKEARIYADVPTRQAVALERGATVAVRIEPERVHTFPADGTKGLGAN